MVNHKQLQLQGFTSTEDPEQKPKKSAFPPSVRLPVRIQVTLRKMHNEHRYRHSSPALQKHRSQGWNFGQAARFLFVRVVLSRAAFELNGQACLQKLHY